VRDRLRRFWGRRLGKVAVILVAAAIVFVAATFGAAAYTERNSFCITACHEMQPYGDTWNASAHHDVDCVRCHIQPGIVALARAKVSALREVYVHFAGQVKAPIAVTKHVPNETCLSCHPQPGDDIALGSGAKSPTVFSHAAHATTGLCIDCHSQVVHTSVPGKPYVDPTTMAFCLGCHDGRQAADACETCHSAPHETRGGCSGCHQLGSWNTTFRHPVPLGKPHKKLICEKCHTKSTTAAMGFPEGCIDCHRNHHHDPQATRCAECHVLTHYVPSTFDHPKTNCQKCHEAKHADRGPCQKCHDQHSWKSHFKHPFSLSGPHTRFACERCHTSGINVPGKGCPSCHNPPHPAYGPCVTCHTMSSWVSHFAHPIALGGPHASFACSRCHVNGITSPGVGCTSCHGSHHGGLTACAQCHTMSGWRPSTFRHPAAGEHSAGSFACTACHPNGNFGRTYCSCHGGNPPNDD